jgi:hypothetical protein
MTRATTRSFMFIATSVMMPVAVDRLPKWTTRRHCRKPGATRVSALPMTSAAIAVVVTPASIPHARLAGPTPDQARPTETIVLTSTETMLMITTDRNAMFRRRIASEVDPNGIARKLAARIRSSGTSRGSS